MPLRLVLSSLALGGLLTACSSNGGSGLASFQLTKISLLEGAVWEVNRKIDFTFSSPVDFASVSLNTINIQTTGGAPATGSFFLRDARTVVFQPTCPTLADLSDSGLKAGGVSYVITVVGQSSGAGNTVRSSTGAVLEVTQVRHFSTPASTEPATAFLDTALGAPVPVLRPSLSSTAAGTYLEVGGDPDQRVYFLPDDANPPPPPDPPDPDQDPDLSDRGFQAPLNLYSGQDSVVAVVIEFNQAVNPTGSNIAESRLRLEFNDAGLWRPLETSVRLVANCTETGARVRLEPIGVLPQGSKLRAVVLPGFQDLVGQTNLLAIDDFAVVPTVEVNFPSLDPVDEKSDELLEGFDFGGSSSASFQDATAVFDTPPADWGGGQLSAGFAFDGTGGPNGDFDWVVGALFPETIDFDTTSTLITSATGTTQLATNGLVDVRNLTIKAGSSIRVQGPEPMIISATGEVRIEGRLDLSGFNARNVATLNTGDKVEVGGKGAAGGGAGGNANEVVTNSTPRGSRGQGAFGQAGVGGEGGETGFAPASAGKDARRPGGGGGGRFARDQVGAGLAAGKGLDGSLLARGGVTSASPPLGGQPGVGPFVDGDTQDDFFGQFPVTSGGQLIDLIRGELPSLWAGYGGGGGGNADPSTAFPTPNWTPASDEKGGAGGGGGGGLHVKALGRIIFGASGEIVADGGLGATGENTLNNDHIGGSGGSGSGGHVILESASLIDFTDEGSNVNGSLRDWVRAVGGPQVTGQATSGGSVSFGGPGGPGVIQLLVPDSLAAPGTNPLTTDIVVPVQAAVSPNPLDAVMSPAGLAMIPSFGSRSKARSRWVSIGGADQNPGGPPDLVRFLFRGTNTATGPDEGKILTSGSAVTPLAALLADNLGALAIIQPDELTLALSGTALRPLLEDFTAGISNQIYLRTPALLRDYVLRLSGSSSQDYRVASASYDEGTASPGDEVLRITVAANAQAPFTLQDFVDSGARGGSVGYSLIPRFFRVVTGGQEDALPSSAFVRVRFQAAADDGFGNPDEANLLVDWTGDIAQFNSLLPGEIQFFRFEVEFDLDAQSMGVSSDTAPVTLDFLRVPFLF